MTKPNSRRLFNAGVEKKNINNNVLSKVDIYCHKDIDYYKFQSILPSIKTLMNQTLQKNFFERGENNIKKILNKYGGGRMSESQLRNRFSLYIKNPPIGLGMNCIGFAEAQCARNRGMTNCNEAEIIILHGRQATNLIPYWFKGYPHLLYKIRVQGLYVVFDLTNRKSNMYHGTVFIFNDLVNLTNTMKMIYGLSEVNFVTHNKKPNRWG